MAVSELITHSSSGDVIDLAVELLGLQVTVKAGSFQLGGVAKQLAADQAFSIVNRSDPAWAIAYLVESESDQSIGLLVDDFVSDGVDTPFRFYPGCGYKCLMRMISIEVPPNTASLDGANVTRWRVLAQPEG